MEICGGNCLMRWRNGQRFCEVLSLSLRGGLVYLVYAYSPLL